VCHTSFAYDLFCALSRGLVYISNANPACSCVYICKFQFRPIHPPSRRLSGRNVLTYVDDIIVKSTKQKNHVADLQETFANFRQTRLKLNPEKCVFGVKKGKFLGCLVSTKGTEANPRKIEAILRMEPPNSKKGAQRLVGRLASLNRFISRSAERNLPFFEILKLAEVFEWGPAQQKAFEVLKQYLIDLTTLTPPSSGTPLLLYVAASHSAVSAALV
jgi:hypothetical protein